MHKQRKFFIGGLLFGLFGYIVFNLCLVVLSSLIGRGSTGILDGALFLFAAIVVSAGLVIWIGGRILRRFGFEVPYYYALFGLLLVWSIAQVVEVFVPISLEIGAAGVFIGAGVIPIAAYGLYTMLLSLIVSTLLGGVAFAIIAAVRNRTSRPTVWLIGIVVALVAVGSMLATAPVQI
jgi:hypothetical protein